MIGLTGLGARVAVVLLLLLTLVTACATSAQTPAATGASQTPSASAMVVTAQATPPSEGEPVEVDPEQVIAAFQTQVNSVFQEAGPAVVNVTTLVVTEDTFM